MWAASVFTLYPEMFPGPLGASMSGTALARGVWSLEAINIREHDEGGVEERCGHIVESAVAPDLSPV